MDNKKEEKKEKDFYYIHFIETHDSNRNFKLLLSSKTKEKLPDCELILEDKYKHSNYYYISKVYRFKVLSSKSFEISIQLQENDGNIYEKKITDKETKPPKKWNNFFLYNTEFKNKNGQNSHSPLKSYPELYPLTNEDQFRLYIKVLREKYKIKRQSLENDEFISLTNSLLEEELKKIVFSLYLAVFFECYESSLVYKHLQLFQLSNMSSLGKISKKQLEIYKENINKIIDDPDIVLKNIEKDEKKNGLNHLDKMILFFNYNYQKEKIDLLFKDADTNKRLFKIIKKHKMKYFPSFYLSKGKINEIIKKASNLSEIKDIIQYNKNTLEFFEILEENKEIILEKVRKEINEGKKLNDICIQVDKLTKLRDDDNLDKILEKIQSLVNYELTNETLFLNISNEFFQMIIFLSDEIDINILYAIKSTIDNYIKKIDKNFAIKNLDTTIHQTGLKFINNGKIKNVQILDFIQKDSYYVSKLFERSPERNLNILKKIEIENIDEEFIEKWNKMDWGSIIKKQEDKFYEIITSLPKKIKDFEILFKLIYEHKKFDKVKFLFYLRNFFLEKANAFKEQLNNNNNIDIISNLIYYSDKTRVNIIGFLEGLEKNLNKDSLINLFVYLLNNKKDLTNQTKNKLTQFLQNENSFENIIKIIKNANKNNEKILSKFSEYLIKIEDFLKVEKSFNMILFKMLVNKNIIKEKEGQNNLFIDLTLKQISIIKDRFIKTDFTFRELSVILEEENNDIFTERLFLLFLIKDTNINNLKNNEDYNGLILPIIETLKTKFNKRKETLNKLQLIYEVYSTFYPNSGKNVIEEIEKLMNNIKEEKLNKLGSDYGFEINNYMDLYYKNAEERAKLKESIFFKSILIKERNNNRDDDTIIFNESLNKFNEIKNLFGENSINFNNEEILGKCIKEFNKKGDNDIREEILRLIDIFNIQIEEKKRDEGIYNIILLSNKDKILNISYSIKKFVEETGAIQEEFTDTLNAIIDTSEDNIEIDYTKMCLDILKSLGIDLFNKENIFPGILLKFNQNPEIIKFLIEKNFEDCRVLQDISNNNDNTFLTPADILDFEKCVEYMNDLGTQNEINSMTDYELIQKAKSISEKEEYRNLELYLSNFIDHYHQIKEIIDQKFNRHETANQRIEKMFNRSFFILTSIDLDYFNATIDGKDLKLIELQDLRDRIIISLNIYRESNINENLKTKYQQYIKFITILLKIKEKLNEIYNIGYIKEVSIKIDIENSKFSFFFISPDFLSNKYNHNKKDKNNNIENILTILNDLLKNIKECQEKGYKEDPFLRYLYGRQFYDLYNYLSNPKCKNIIRPLLNYITNNKLSEEEDIQVDFHLKEDNNNYSYIINNCIEYIKLILKKININLDDIYKDSKIQIKLEKQKNEGVFIYSCNQIEKELFQLYKYLTGNIPVAQNVLLCNKETSNEEITSFLYRAILCKYHSCFIVGGIESLNFNQKNHFLEVLNQLIPKESKEIKSCLVILSVEKDAEIYKTLTLKYKNTFPSKIENELKKIQLNDLINIKMFSSDISGVGKSTQIKNRVNKNNNYIYFPIGGAFTRKNIFDRLTELKLNEKSEIHLDINDTDNIDLMMEFLFSVLITKIYKVNEDIFYINKNIKFYIEIPNGFVSFKLKFPILDLIPKNMEEVLSIKKLPHLIVPKELDSDIQIVSNYLKQLNDYKINEFNIDIPNVTPSDLAKFTFITKQAEVIPDEEAEKLIFDVVKKYNKTPSYYQISSLIKVLACQFKKFNQSFRLHPFYLNNARIFRTFIVESFIKLSTYFTEGTFTNLINQQNVTSSIEYPEYNEKYEIEKIEEGIDDLIENLEKEEHKKMSFDKINHTLLFFHEGNGEGFSIITNKDKNDNEYKNFYKLRNCQITNEKDLVDLPNYTNYTQIDFLRELKEILNLNTAFPLKKKDTNDEYKQSLEEIANNYVFTPDNFVKMILILIRIRSNIPVILMGETGCGKTSLIKKLFELKNYGSHEYLEILNIHAGTNDKDIIDFIRKINDKSKRLYKSQEDEREKAKKSGMLYEEKKIWVFLDEINTCKSMGLISELMCKHSYQGKKLEDNIVFIAACNPYRKSSNDTKNKIIKVGLDINQAVNEKEKLNDKEKKNIENSKFLNNKLVYTVNPLPHSLLHFVIDFGHLKEEDEEKYIERMIEGPMNKIFNLNEENLPIENLKTIKKQAKEMIIAAQNFIRNEYDISSVSLREIRRFIIFYEFYYHYLKKKKKKLLHLIRKQIEAKEISVDYSNLNELEFQLYSINLAIYICYYLRISDRDLRKNFVKEINEIFIFKDFLKLPQLEEKFIADNIQIDKGIAKNKALLENVFSIFSAINTKIPIFIVGKPGCSKSLSVQLINKSMKGKSSSNDLFKELPNLLTYSFQGSLSSTSEGVLAVFKKANDSIVNLKDQIKDNIVMIFFDEMGLAEYSPNNPLKVIHSKLEYDEIETNKKVAFVGISNWALDASKMNRGIHISISDPNQEDNIQTALAIADSYDQTLRIDYNQFFSNLALIYYQYKQYLKKYHGKDGKEDFHGNRDFYYFIKYASSKLLFLLNEKKYEKDFSLSKIGNEGIERNFSGIFYSYENKTSTEIVKEFYNKLYPNNNVSKSYNIIQRIKENNEDKNSRYLLLISKASQSCYLLSSISQKDNYTFFIGSQFDEDIKSEEYQLKIINKIKIYMEEGGTIVLKNLESVYPALYELFNQNFTVMCNKSFTRISIGSSLNIFTYVNDKFKCIVNVDIDKIDKQEAPFLNRFEKHIVTYENLLNEELIYKSKEIKKIIDDVISFSKNNKRLNYNFENLMINCELEEIQGIIYNANKKGINETKDLLKEVLKKVGPVLPQDVVIPLLFNESFENKNLILEYYKEYEHTNLSKYLQNLSSKKHVVYTFSKIFDRIDNIYGIKNENLNLNIEKGDIKIIKIAGIKSENELESNINDFFNTQNKYKICLIQIIPKDSNLINYIKFFIENKENEFKNNSKIFIFIVHMMRIFSDDKPEIINKKKIKETISNLSEYEQIFIDDLNGKENINEIIDKKKENILKYFIDNKLSDLKLISTNTISDISNKFSFFGNVRKEKIIKFITENDNTKKMIFEYIEKDLINILKELFQNNEKKKDEEINFASDKDIDMINIIKNYLSNIFLERFFFILSKIENSLLPHLLFIEKEDLIKKDDNKNKAIINELISIYFKDFLSQEENINIIEKVSNYIKKNISQEYRTNEFNLRRKSHQEETDEEKPYWDNINKFCNFTVIELKKNNFILIIDEKIKDENIINYIYNLFIFDFYNYYIKNHLYDNDKIKDDVEKQIKAMLLNIINLHNDKFKEIENDVNNLRLLADTLNWLDCYKNEIILLLKIYLLLESLKNNLLSKAKLDKTKLFEINENFLESNKGRFSYEESERVPRSSSIVNEVFFLVLECMLYLLTSNHNIYNNECISETLNIIKQIIQNASKLNENLFLFSKELFSLKEILEIIDMLCLNKINNEENINSLINLVSQESVYINSNKIEELNLYLDELKNFILKVFGQNKNISKIMNIIFENEFSKIPNQEVNLNMLKIMISNNDYIYESSNLIKLILGDFVSILPDDFEENLEKLKKHDELMNILNNCDNLFLEEILLNYFEFQINLYFKNIPEISDENILSRYFSNYSRRKSEDRDDPSILDDQPLSVFEEAIKLLTEISESQNEKKINLCKLYSIAYIKIYLNKLVYYASEKYQAMPDVTRKMRSINEMPNQNLSNIIKLYIFKELYEIKKKDREEFAKFNVSRKFGIAINNKQDLDSIVYYFLPTKENCQKYSQEYNNFVGYKNSKFREQPSILFKEYINKFGLDTLVVIILNLIQKKFCKEKAFNINKKEYLYLYSTIKENILQKNFEDCKLNEIITNYYSYENESASYDNKLENISQKTYVILLYGFRYYAQSIINKGLFSSFVNKDCFSSIKKMYIPGIDNVKDLHILTLLDIENHFKKYPSNRGCYVCSCGYYYSLNIGDIPTEKDELLSCPKCHENIGFEKINISKKIKYELIKRKGHYRIFKDENEKKREMKKYNSSSNEIPNKTLCEYIKEVIEPLENKANPGIELINKDIFISKKKRIRGLSMPTYRLLNFVFYNHLFFANLFGFLSDEELEKYFLIEGMSILKIIEYDWKELKEALDDELIPSIEIFMNQIFPKLSQLINDVKELKSVDERKIFEDKVEKLVRECINNYDNYKKEYIEENYKLIEDKKEDLNAIINELIPPEKYENDDKLKDKYPMFKYFMKTKYPDLKMFEAEFKKKANNQNNQNNYNKYPLLNQILYYETNAKKLKYLHEYNNFSNALIDYYSFKISREEAQKTQITEIYNINGDENISFDEEKLKKFIEISNEIKEDSVYYKEWKMNIKELSENDNLIFFLNDNNENNFGMHIAAAYQSFIYWQNDFIQGIIDSSSQKNISHFYTNNLKNKIPVQNAKDINILSLDDNVVENIISQYSKRNIFEKNGKINYLNYNSFIYDFDAIENELGKLILTDKCLFDEDRMKFISFKNENNSKIISDFYNNYKQEDLSDKEEKTLELLFNGGDKIKDFKDFFNSLLMIFFFLNYNKANEEENLVDLINEIPIYINISDDFREVIINEFSEKGKELKINKLYNTFIYLENLYLNENFENICKNLNDNKFGQEFDDMKAIKNKIDNFNDKKGLFMALKRYIFRYLVDNQNINNIENTNLIFELGKSELWDLKAINVNDIKRNLNSHFKDFIKVGNVKCFSYLLNDVIQN